MLAHEDEALKNGFNSEIAAIKREYYRICLRLMDDLKRDRKLDFNSRTAVMSLFGMINWIYTWYNPRQDGTAKDLAQQMSEIVLSGVGCGTVHEDAAAKRRKNIAHGASRGSRIARHVKPRRGEREIEKFGGAARRKAHAAR